MIGGIIMIEIIEWVVGRPKEDGHYLIQSRDNTVDVAYYYTNGDIFYKRIRRRQKDSNSFYIDATGC